MPALHEQHAAERRAGESRSTAPVFVVGCPRSGTTYLYHVLLSAGNFAIYRAESEVFHLLEPRFGDLGRAANKKRLLAEWFRSRLFTATGLERQLLEDKIMRECANAGDFLRIVMEETARHQGVRRWADCTPDHALYLPRIKATIPNALVIHIIRDGRDVALSMEKQGWPKQLPWDRVRRALAGAVYWEWMTQRGRRDGAKLDADYIEVRYEELVEQPRKVLKELSGFVGQELDYDEIQRVAIGSVGRPNTSFKEEGGGFSPVGRWKKAGAGEVAQLEQLVGPYLRKLGYECLSSEPTVKALAFRRQYRAYFESKFLLRAKTPLGRLLVTRDLSRV
ncbi:MAG TPA: sulfotransferase [Candidatus Solibacter sp.]|nr:sulfotransferase [Candidatus Solibacter sp.]